LHASSTTIRDELLPFWWSQVKGQGHQGQKKRLVLPTPTLVRTNGMHLLQAACSSSVQQQHAAAVDGRISWLPRGDFGDLRALARLGGAVGIGGGGVA